MIDIQKPPSGRTVIPNYDKEMLKTESFGILKWMAKGAKDVLTAQRRRKPLVLTTAQTDRIEELLTSEDTILQFVRASIKAEPGTWITSEDLHMAYENYCLSNQLDALTQTTFNRNIGKALKKLLPGTSHRNVGDPGERKQKGYADITL